MRTGVQKMKTKQKSVDIRNFKRDVNILIHRENISSSLKIRVPMGLSFTVRHAEHTPLRDRQCGSRVCAANAGICLEGVFISRP